jgi:3D (Asp-Asp-Asp) domain-containing protein
MFLSRSTGRKFVITATAAVSFALLYEVTTLDSRYVVRVAEHEELTAKPAPGVRLRFTATAYCKGTTTASGVNVRTGIAAADPDLLPVGSVVQIDRLGERYNGVYTVMDTGPKVHGRHLDLYMWDCNEALRLGRRQMLITVLRMGWNPQNSSPKLVERLFRQREAVLPPPPAWPPPAKTESTPDGSATPASEAAPAPASPDPAAPAPARKPAPPPAGGTTPASPAGGSDQGVR